MRQRSNGRKRFKVVVLGVLVLTMNFNTSCAIIGAIMQIVGAALSMGGGGSAVAGKIVSGIGNAATRMGPMRQQVQGSGMRANPASYGPAGTPPQGMLGGGGRVQ